MALLRQDQLSAGDIGINGISYILEEDDPSPFQVQAADDLLERSNIDTQLEQNKIDTLYWGANRSWHEGQGQTRLDVPPRFAIDPTTASSPYKHLRSKGVDITQRGQLTLLHQTSLALALTNQSPARQAIGVNDSFVFVASGQPNIRRFSTLNASDAVTIASGTTTSQDVQDFASDGSNVYAALGPDGTSLATPITTTQREAFDVTTGWSFSTGSGSFAADTTTKKEGLASLRMDWGPGVTLYVIEKVVAFNFSSADQFKVWFQAQGGPQNTWTMRLLSSAGNYFEAPLTVGVGFTEFTFTKSSFTSVGAPNWASITKLQFTVTAVNSSNAFSAWFDDFRSQQQTAFAAWSTWDARVLGWANDQLFAAGVKTGTQWRFFKAAAGAGSAEVYVLPDGWVVTSIRSLGGLVYFSAYRGGKGVVYVYDGTNAPTIACPAEALGLGTIPLSLTPFAGAGMLIGCRRLTPTASGGLGVLYRGFPDAAGSLRIERLAIIGVDDGRDYGVRTGMSFGDWSYFGWNYGDEPAGENFLVNQTKRSGLGIYWPETGGWGRSYLSAPGTDYSGIVEDCAVFKGRRMFSVGGIGLFVEQATYEPEGGVVTSLIDNNVMADKIWLAQESYYSATEAISSPVAHAYSFDALTWANDTGAGGSGTSVHLRTSFNALGLKSPSLYARTRLLTTNGLVSPVLYFTGIGGYPATKPLPLYVLTIRAFPAMENLDISRSHIRDAGYAVVARLMALWTAQTIVDFQPPWAFTDSTTLPNGISYRVRVAEVMIDKGWNSGSDVVGGQISVKLKVCP